MIKTDFIHLTIDFFSKNLQTPPLMLYIPYQNKIVEAPALHEINNTDISNINQDFYFCRTDIRWSLLSYWDTFVLHPFNILNHKRTWTICIY